MILYVSPICVYRCSGHVPFLTADDYEKHMTELMEEIHNNIPKVFVNYILLLNVSQVYLSYMNVWITAHYKQIMFRYIIDVVLTIHASAM